jgi:hypothetical protein
MNMPKHPVQPLIKDKDGIIRFQENPIVSVLKDFCQTGQKIDLNGIWALGDRGMVSRDDLAHFYQLIGYSVSGYEELSALPLPENFEEMKKKASTMRKKKA